MSGKDESDSSSIPDTRILQPDAAVAPSRPTAPSRGPSSHAWSGRQIGDYEIERVLGAGGMGVVYLARQRHPQRQVAIKTLISEHDRPDLLARFQQEAEILGRLKHPGIAQVYATGVAELDEGTQPYIVMEYVDGAPLLAATTAMDLRRKVELLARICDAMEHAHIRGVIHRDLKPSNIMVQADGQPKVLDFGVARMTATDPGRRELTSAGMVIGTMAYMSPEQAGGDPNEIDIRSDVYALGVIAYRLLTGQMPYDIEGQGIGGALRAIAEAAPRPLTQLVPGLAADLEVVVLKALAKDREARYQNAAEFADDLRRYLNDESVHARRPSLFAELRRFARRNRAFVAGLAIAALALVAATVLVTGFAVREQAQRRQADATLEFLRSLLSRANPVFAQGREVTVREVMSRAEQELDLRLADAPDARARVSATLAETYDALGDSARALDLYRKARADFAPDSEVGLAAALGEAAVLTDVGRLREARPLAQDTWTALRRLHGPDHLLSLRAQWLLGRIQSELGDLDAAHETLSAVLQGLSRAQPQNCTGCSADSRSRLEHLARSELGLVRRSQGDLEGAIRWGRENLAQARNAFGPTDPDTLDATTDLSTRLDQAGLRDESVALLEAALAEFRRILGDAHPQTLRALTNLAVALKNRGEEARARTLFEQALADARSNLDRRSPITANLLGNLGNLKFVEGDLAGAEQDLAEAYAMRLERLGPNHPETLKNAMNLAVLYSATQRPELAGPLIEGALRGTAERFGDEHRQTITARSEWASFLRDRGEFVRADREFAQALASADRLLPRGDGERLRVLYQYSGSLQRQKRMAEALALSQRLSEEAAESKDRASTFVIAAPLRHARSLMGVGRDQEAEQLLLTLDRQLADGSQARIRELTRSSLVELYETRGDLQAAARFRQ